MNEIRGWHVLSGFIVAFGIIVAVNLTLAFSAVATFPGLEVKNSYVASQGFEQRRQAQKALGWTARAWLEGGTLILAIESDEGPVAPTIEGAIFGNATHVGQDMVPQFHFDGQVFAADVGTTTGNWNLRLTARAVNGVLFQQRIVVEAGP